MFKFSLLIVIACNACALAAPVENVEQDASIDAGSDSGAPAEDCYTGSWLVRAEYALPPDMWAGGEVVCKMIKDLPEEQAALWTCHNACAD